MLKQPLISIVTINFNGKKWLKGYCKSLNKQTYRKFEVIFVDNGSSDESVSYIKTHCPNLVLIENKVNYAITKGNNIGFRKAKGDIILLLNNDTEFDRNYLEEVVLGFKTLPQASILQTKIVLMDNPSIHDSCGQFWTDTGFVYHYGNHKSTKFKMYDKPFKILAGKSASMALKKEVVDKCGVYDDLYWGYYEETDHCHRAWIAGLETWYWPKAEVKHGLGGTTLTFESDFLQYHNFKNKISSFLVNFSIWYLLYLMPVFFVLNVIIAIGWLFQGKRKNTLSLFKAIWWSIKNLDHIIKRRKEVQRTRILSDGQIFDKVRKNPKWAYYYYLFTTELSKYKDEPL